MACLKVDCRPRILFYLTSLGVYCSMISNTYVTSNTKVVKLRVSIYFLPRAIATSTLVYYYQVNKNLKKFKQIAY